MRQQITIQVVFILIFLYSSSCKKYLDAKPDSNLSTLETLEDLQAFMDDHSVLNDQYPQYSEYMSDNFYLTTTDFNGITNNVQRSLYKWEKVDIPIGNAQWPYAQILNCNIALDELKDLSNNNEVQVSFNNIKGSALFFRAFYFYATAQLYCEPYNKNTASAELGIPLRLSPNFTEASVRATVEQTYQQIIADLKESSTLLPDKQLVKTRPSKAAAFGALARTYLSMASYDSAGIYADHCLKAYDSLLDYNSLDSNILGGIPRFNKEVIFYARSSNPAILNPRRAKTDSILFKSYNHDDLRRALYFISNNNGTYAFKGDYDGSGVNSGFVFSGIVTDEMYLIRAESHARAGRMENAMKDLNTLLETRWRTGTFKPFAASSADEALKLILQERRKELLFRGTRWTDLRRLRNEPGLAIIPKRVIDGQTYELLPNSNRYVLQIPAQVIQQTGMPQNP